MLPTYPVINYNGLEKRKDATFEKFASSLKKDMTPEFVESSRYFQKLKRKLKKVHYLEKNYSNFLFRQNKPKTRYLINFFTRNYDYDYWKNVYVFKTTNMNDVLYDLEILDVQVNGSRWSSPYDCTGRTFFQPCEFIELEDRIIVTQTGALDV